VTASTRPGIAAALGVERSLSGRRWAWRATPGAGIEREGLAISQRLDVPDIVGRLLAGRGIGVDAAADFLEPTLRALLPDPDLLRDMPAAAGRLADAVTRGETVAIFGDYDVDGACSGAIMCELLRAFGCEVIPYVPDRMTEGYGPNAAALRALVGRGATLVVCVDCGTAAADVLAEIDGDADIVIIDHHKAEGPPPRVVATVNPNRLDCPSRLGSLCAAALAFLVGVATLRELRRRGRFASAPEPDLRQLLDLVALATVCDVMPLVGLNRALVTQGLKVMARRERIGIAALLDVAQVHDRPSAMTLGFALGPRINAGGRISDSGLGLRLLGCSDPVEARELAARLDAVNRQRQEVEAGMLEAALAAAADQFDAGHAVALVAGLGWHPGVVGIVAGRIKEKFNRPACVAGIAEGMAKGSGRSVVGLDLGTAVIAARQMGILATGGGHAMAAGFSFAEANEAEFHAFLDDRLQAARALPAAADLLVEATVSVTGCTTDIGRQIARLAPFGSGNDEPTLALPRVRIVRADRVGRDATTIRAFVEGEGGGKRLKAVAFRARDSRLAETLLSRESPLLHLAGPLRAEEWNGSVTPSFIITDAAHA
jgi:single-stranded-DNA-specific exonuclease